jgi:ferrous iron transport protein A
MFTQGFSVCFSSLALLKNQERGVISCLRNKDETIVQKLKAMGITPGRQIAVETKTPHFVITLGKTRIKIDSEMARSIYVRVT